VQNNINSIDESVLTKVFDPYYTTKEDSMGLGLYMAKIIIESHMQGSISAKKVDNKIRFTIKLPLIKLD
jgi:signal transduction histidine kinase